MECVAVARLLGSEPCVAARHIPRDAARARLDAAVVERDTARREEAPQPAAARRADRAERARANLPTETTKHTHPRRRHRVPSESEWFGCEAALRRSRNGSGRETACRSLDPPRP